MSDIESVKERLRGYVALWPGGEVAAPLCRDALAVIEAQEKEIARRYLLTPEEKMLIDKLRAAASKRPEPLPERPFFGDRLRRG